MNQKYKTNHPFFVGSKGIVNISARTVSGAAISIGSQGLKFLIGMGSTVVLARLLTPQDFGLLAMTGVATGFLTIFKDAGLAMATIQRKEISHEQVSTLFWSNFALSCLLGILLYVSAPHLSAFYNEPRVTEITKTLCLTFILGGASIQHRALLRRSMRFRDLAVLEITTITIGTIVSIVLAYLGYGYWSLVWATISVVILDLIGCWYIAQWIPSFPKKSQGVMQMVEFGKDILIFDTVNYFSRRGDDFLIGWKWGSESLAYYSKAYALLLMPIQQIYSPIRNVIIPALSRLTETPKKYKTLFINAIELVVGGTVPIVISFFIFADEIIMVMLGPQWKDCAYIFRLLTVGALVAVINIPAAWLMVSTGRTRIYKNIGIYTSILFVISFSLGLPYGIEGVAVAYSISATVSFFPSWIFATRNSPVEFYSVLCAFFAPLTSAIVAGLLSCYFQKFVPTEVNSIIKMLFGFSTFGLVYLVVLLILFGRLELYIKVLKQLGIKK